jgi:RNA polymerase sigma-70 factor (ECF subfamily)
MRGTSSRVFGIAERSRVGRASVMLAALYRREATAATRLAYALTGDRDAAEDVVHDAFVKVGGKVFSFRDPEHARAYLMRTVINLCRGRGRKMQIERRGLSKLESPGPPHSVPVSSDDEMWTALLHLPIRQRAALFLRYYQDLSEQEAADALGCSLSALKSLVNRGLRALRVQLKEELDERS